MSGSQQNADQWQEHRASTAAAEPCRRTCAKRFNRPRRYGASLLDHLRLAGDERHRGVAVFADHGMYAAIRKVAHVPGAQLARFVEIRTLDHEEQLVTDVLVPRQLRARLKAPEDSASLRGRIAPERLPSHAGHCLRPRNLAEYDNLRTRRI